MNEKQSFIYKETARSIERCFPRSDLAREFQLELKGKKSVYDALIESGKARDFHQAVRLVAEKFPPSRAGFTSSWSQLAEFSWDMDHT